MRKSSHALIAAALTASLAGCSGEPSAEDCQESDISAETAEQCLDVARAVAGDELAAEESSADESGAAAEPSPDALPELAGPATEPAVFSGGVTAEIVSVESVPAEAWVGEDNPGHDTLVRVTVQLSTGPDGYPLATGEIDGPDGELLFGPNLTPAQGWMVDQEQPTLVTEDSPVTLLEEFSLPADGLNQLEYVYTPARGFEEPWTFTGVEQMID